MRLHVRSCDQEVCLFYYVQIAIGDFYYAQQVVRERACDLICATQKSL